jgi:hypothetical protein
VVSRKATDGSGSFTRSATSDPASSSWATA